MHNDNRTEPLTSILCEGTLPNYTTFCPDSGITGIKPGLTCYKTASAYANGCDLTSAEFGDAIITESTIISPEIPENNVAFAKSWEKDTAFPATNVQALGSSFKGHVWRIGDKIWIKTGGVNTVALETILVPFANGLWGLAVGITVDKYEVHKCKALQNTTGQDWQMVEYIGRGSSDAI